jgi:phosphoribosylformylglycinamidine synthase
MCIGGDVGAQIDLTGIADLRTDIKLFSESNTRWLVEVPKENEEKFHEIMKVPVYKIGSVGGSNLTIMDGEKSIIDTDVSSLRKAWNDTLWEMMG